MKTQKRNPAMYLRSIRKLQLSAMAMVRPLEVKPTTNRVRCAQYNIRPTPREEPFLFEIILEYSTLPGWSNTYDSKKYKQWFSLRISHERGKQRTRESFTPETSWVSPETRLSQPMQGNVQVPWLTILTWRSHFPNCAFFPSHPSI